MDNAISMGALFLAIATLVYVHWILSKSRAGRLERKIVDWMNATNEEVEHLELAVLKQKRQYNVMLAREKANGQGRPRKERDEETSSVDNLSGFAQGRNESGEDWKRRIRGKLATGELKRPS